jgi:hypothetical protein
VGAKDQTKHQVANKQQLAKAERKAEEELSRIEHRAIIVLGYQLFKSVRRQTNRVVFIFRACSKRKATSIIRE